MVIMSIHGSSNDKNMGEIIFAIINLILGAIVLCFYCSDGIKEPDLWFDCWMKPRSISIFRGFFKMKNNENKRYVAKAVPLYKVKERYSLSLQDKRISSCQWCSDMD